MSRLMSALRWFNWLLVLAAALLLIFPNPANPWVLALVPLILLLQAFVWRSILPITPLNPAILLLSIAILASLYATTDLVASYPKIAGLFSGLLIFFTITRSGNNPRTWKIALLVFCLLGFGITGISIFGTRWLVIKFPALSAITALLPLHLTGLEGASEGFSPNEVAGVLLWVVPVMIGATFAIASTKAEKVHIAPRWLWILAFALASLLTLGVLFLTQSRGAYLGLAIAIFLAMGLTLPRRIRQIGVVFIGLTFIIAISVFSSLDAQPITELTLESDTIIPAGFDVSNSISLREQIWSRSIWGIKDFGLLGMGMNRFRSVFPQLYPSFVIPINSDIAHAHNEFLNVGVELGYLGLIAFISLNITVAAMLWQIIHKAEREGTSSYWIRWLALGLGTAWLSHFLYGMTDAIALGARPGFLFWFLLALITGLYQISVEKEINTA